MRPRLWAARRSSVGTGLLADPLERTVALELRLRDQLADRGTRGLAVPGLAGRGDRVRFDLRSDVRRGAEVLAVPTVRIRERLHDRVVRVDREERVVRAADLPVRREEAVRAEQLDAGLACGLELLAEGLGLRSKLP